MDGTEHETTVHVYDSGNRGLTTFVIGGMHGDETSGYLAADEIATWSVTTGKLVVIPRANVEAIQEGIRGIGYDLNRQFPPTDGECTHPLAQAIWDEVVRHDPDWAFDLHSSYGIYKSGDGGVGQATFPTWTDPARSNGENTVADLNDAFGLTGDMAYRMGNTVDADEDMLMHRIAGILDRPGYITETTEKAPLDDQVQWHLYTVEHAMAQYGQERGTELTAAPESTLSFDAGTIYIDDYWQTYGVDNTYTDPVVVAPSITHIGADPAHARLKNVGSNSFEARVEEWAYLNDRHYDEYAGYLMFEAGTHTTDDGKRIEAGKRNVNHNWNTATFDAYADTPVVLATPQTRVGEDPVVARIQNVTPSSFEYRVQEEDANDDWHYEELMGWVVLPQGPGVLGGRNYEAGYTATDERWRHIDFGRSYDNPSFLANTTTYNGWNSVTVRYDNLTSTGVDVFVEEEQSDDPETGHIHEDIAYVVIEG